MTVGLTYDLRTEWLAQGYSELETAEFDREETVAAVEAAVRAEGAQRTASGTTGAHERACRREAAGPWYSTSPRGCTGWRGKRWCRRSSMPIGYPTPFRNRLCCRFTAQGSHQAHRAGRGCPHPGLCRCRTRRGPGRHQPPLSALCQAPGRRLL